MFEEEIEELEMVATDMRGAGEQMQAELDEALPVLRGMYSQTAMNALVDAANSALVAGGFEGD